MAADGETKQKTKQKRLGSKSGMHQRPAIVEPEQPHSDPPPPPVPYNALSNQSTYAEPSINKISHVTEGDDRNATGDADHLHGPE